MFISPELSEKYWMKMPGDLGNQIKQAFDIEYPGVTIALTPRILFTYQYLEQKCKDAAFQRSLKNLSFCSQIPIPEYYRDHERKRYDMRKSTTYKGKPHPSHARIEKRKHLLRNKKCKCYLCGEEGHFARECPSERRNTCLEDHDIVLVQEGEDLSDAIFSISENEDQDESLEHRVQTLRINMLGEIDGGYRPQIKLPPEQMTCSHEWQYNHQKNVPVEPTQHTTEQPSSFHKLILQQSEYIVWCDAEITHLRKENQYLCDQLLLQHLSSDLEELTLQDQQRQHKGKNISQSEADCFILQAETAHAATGGGGKIIRNRLYNLTAQIEIPGVKAFSVREYLDTGATTCCIDENSVPKEALEDNTFIVQFTGVNSQQNTNKKLKPGQMTIGENQFRIPYTYAFPMFLGGEIHMIIGYNFIRAMQGGLRIEGDTITFNKNVTTINTQQQAIISSLSEEIDDLEYIQTQEAVLYTAGPTPPNFKIKFQQIIKKLKEAGYIGENPLKHWSKNKVTCKITLKNPDFIIEDRPLKHVTPQMKDSFEQTSKGANRVLMNLEYIQQIQGLKWTTMFEKQETDLTTKSGLRSWLGILNYARNFIPNLGKLLAPLYRKTRPTGEKKFNQQDRRVGTKMK
ncbi:hypothetical protein EJ110_NYTH58966 [Nymphaea thermarum]|nr:hypothetical protein EJ110_NYTH58966 [Nymphaea thermarum]